MTSETALERQRRQSRESHARWVKKHPRRARLGRKRWRATDGGRACEARRLEVKKTQRDVMRALSAPGAYVVLRPDGGTTELRRDCDGRWEVLR